MEQENKSDIVLSDSVAYIEHAQTSGALPGGDDTFQEALVAYHTQAAGAILHSFLTSNGTDPVSYKFDLLGRIKGEALVLGLRIALDGEGLEEVLVHMREREAEDLLVTWNIGTQLRATDVLNHREARLRCFLHVVNMEDGTSCIDVAAFAIPSSTYYPDVNSSAMFSEFLGAGGCIAFSDMPEHMLTTVIQE